MKRAITLVELLVVLVVVCIAAALFFPTGHRSRANARRSSCQSNLKQISLAFAQYSQDFRRLPRATGNGARWGWASALTPYHKENRVYECPSDATKRQNDPKRASYTDYWFNARFSDRKIASFHVPERAICVGDGDGNSPLSDARYALFGAPQQWRADENSPLFRHLGVANYLFVDGHVKSVNARQIGENWHWD